MATRDVFSGEELAQLRGFPEIGRSEPIRYFTLTPADEAFVRKFAIAVPQTVVAAGGRLPLGSVLQFIQSARVTNLTAVRAWRQSDPDGTINVQLGPGESKGMTVRAAPPGVPG